MYIDQFWPLVLFVTVRNCGKAFVTPDWLGRATSLIKVTVGYQNVSTSVSMLASVQ